MDKRYLQACTNLTEQRLKFYDELTPLGKAFVDRFAVQILSNYRGQSGGRGYGMGEQAARELAVAMLQDYWTGEIPQGFWDENISVLGEIIIDEVNQL